MVFDPNVGVNVSFGELFELYDTSQHFHITLGKCHETYLDGCMQSNSD